MFLITVILKKTEDGNLASFRFCQFHKNLFVTCWFNSGVGDDHILHGYISNICCCFTNLFNHIHTLNNLSKYSVMTIQPWRWDQSDEKLATISVLACNENKDIYIGYSSSLWLLMIFLRKNDLKIKLEAILTQKEHKEITYDCYALKENSQQLFTEHLKCFTRRTPFIYHIH